MPSEDTVRTATEQPERPDAHSGRVVEDAVAALCRAWMACQLYCDTHPVAKSDLAAAVGDLNALLARHSPVTIKNIDGELVCGDESLFTGDVSPTSFIEALTQRNVGCITFTPGVDASDLRVLCTILNEDPSKLEGNGGARRRLIAAGVRHIDIDRLTTQEHGDGDETSFAGMPLTEFYQSAVQAIGDTMHAVRVGLPIDVRTTQAITNEMVVRVTQDPSAATVLSCLKSHDEYSFAHSVHTALLSLALGEAVGLTDDELHELGVGAILHDVGKVFTPADVLAKPGPLSDAERATVERHPGDGAAILMAYADLPPLTPVVALEHHLHCDLSGGYPRLHERRPPSIFSLIVSVGDVYDALTTERPYRRAFTPYQALSEMRRTGARRFDQQLLQWFEHMLGVFPPGTLVELNTGEYGVVCRTNPQDGARPDVYVVVDGTGARLKEPYEVSLAGQRLHAPGRKLSIVRTLNPEKLDISTEQILHTWLRLEEASDNEETAD